MPEPDTILPLTVPPEWVDEVYAEDGGGGPLWHTECCRPDVAVCGEDITDAINRSDADEDGEECVFCERIVELDLPCGEPFCRLRRRMPWRRRSR